MCGLTHLNVKNPHIYDTERLVAAKLHRVLVLVLITSFIAFSFSRATTLLVLVKLTQLKAATYQHLNF